MMQLQRNKLRTVPSPARGPDSKRHQAPHALAGAALCVAVLLMAPAAAFASARLLPTPGQRGNVRALPQSYLGIDVRDVGDDQVANLKLKDTHGAEIIRVDHDAPAGKMGLREHDVVLQMNGVTIADEDQLRRLMHDCPPGKLVVMTIARDGQTLTTSAPMADRVEIEHQVWVRISGTLPFPPAGPQAPEQALPAAEAAALPAAAASSPSLTTRYSKSFLGNLLLSPNYTGVVLESMRPQLAQYFGAPGGSGLLVSSVADNSPAAMAGIKVGDVIFKANSKSMNTMSHWTKAIREAKGKPVTVEVVRDHQQKILTLTPDVKRRSALEMPEPFSSMNLARI